MLKTFVIGFDGKLVCRFQNPNQPRSIKIQPHVLFDSVGLRTALVVNRILYMGLGIPQMVVGYSRNLGLNGQFNSKSLFKLNRRNKVKLFNYSSKQMHMLCIHWLPNPSIHALMNET